MELFTKTNPKATWQTVVRHAVMTCIVGTLMYATILWWNGWGRDWWIKLAVCAVLLLLVAGLWEWQIPENNDSDTEPVEPFDTMD